MKYALAFMAALLVYAASPANTALACEGCVRGSKLEPTEVACLESPDGPGEICTAGGGYCNEEGSCGNRLAGDGSLLPVDGTSQFTSVSAASKPIVRRACDDGVVARGYESQHAARMRAQSSTLTI